MNRTDPTDDFSGWLEKNKNVIWHTDLKEL